MELRILGPLEVRVGERSPPLGGGRQRALLALLVLHRNQVVATDRIVDDLWGDQPPATVSKALQVYVSRLRKLLGAERILTQPPGYRLVAGPEDVDLDRFERLRERAAAADPRGAAELLREALELWRGPPLGDLAYEPFLQPELARLSELRMTTIEDRVDADLAVGRHAEVVGELEELVARDPLRERLRGQLMLALYRAGRQADALEAFRRARAALVDELAIEPGTALQDLHRRLLEQDPALSPTAPAPDPPPLAQDAAEELKLVTVVVADAVVDEPDPEAMRTALREHEAAAADELGTAGGRVESCSGGSVVATYGAASALEDHAARALRAALALSDRLPGGVRVGVESGEVLVCPAEVTGPPMAAARRLAAAAGAGEVAAGARVLAAAGEGFAVTHRARTAVVTAALAAGPRREHRRFGRTFVGRDSELDLLTATFERVVRDGRAHVVSVVGDAGVGKTSLMGALRARLGDDAAWFTGRCPAFGRAVTYRPIGDVLRARFGIGESDSPQDVRARLAGRDVLLLALGHDTPEDLHPFRARELLLDAWVEVLQELADEGPAVVALEDLHWADEALLELVDRAGRDVDGPLLLLVTARPEAAVDTGRRNATRVWLEPLGRGDAERMIAVLAPGLPSDVRDAVLDRAEGNPFFVEEVLAALLDEGATPPGARLPAALPAGDSVQSVIAARIDRLPPDERAALQAAAVVGRSFWRGAVGEMLDRPRISLDLLEERDFVRRAPRSAVAGDRELVFKHALTREVAYGSLAGPRRARLHAACAEWLERERGGDEHAAAIAHHLAQALSIAETDARRVAVLRASATRWLRRAADLAFRRYELADAAALYAQAAGHAAEDGTRAELLRAAARAHLHRFDLDGFRSTMERAIALAPPGADAARLQAELAIEGAQPFLWRRPPARQDVIAWTTAALDGAGDGRTKAIALLAAALTDPAHGSGHAAAAVRLARSLDSPTLLGKAYEAHAFCATAEGRLDQAMAWADRAMELAPAMDDPDRRSGRLFYGVFAHLRAGDVPGALRIAAEHDEITARLTTHHEVHAVAARLLAETLAGRWSEAAALAPRMEQAAGGNLDTPCQFNWRGLLVAAYVAAVAGDDREARRLEDRAGEIAALGGPLAREPSLLRLALVRGDTGEVERILAADPGADGWDVDYGAARLDALAAVADRDRVEEEAERAVALGGYVAPFGLRALGTVRGDRALLERAAAAFSAIGLEWRAAETRAAPPAGGADRAASRRAAS